LRIVGVDIVTSEPFRTFELRSETTRIDAMRWMGTPGGVAITETFAARHKLRIDSPLTVVVNGREEQLTVLGIVAESDVPVDSRMAVMDLGWIQELLKRPGRLSSLQIRVSEPDRAETVAANLAKTVPGYEVRPPRQRSAQVGKMIAAFQLNLSALSLVSLLVGVFLVFNTVSTSVARRRVQIGILRALGVTRWEVRWLFLGEALLYALPGIALGTVGGVLLAQQLSGAVERTVTSLYTLVHIERLMLDPAQFVIASTYGVLAALIGAWAPAAEASRVEPVEALRRSVGEARASVHARRWWIGGLCSAAFAAFVAWLALSGAPRWLAFASAFLVLVSASLFAPIALSLTAAAAGRVKAPALRLAVPKLRRRLRRNAITVGALGAAVAMFIALAIMVHSFRRSLDAWIGKGIIADLFIAPAANEHLGLNSFLPADAVEWLRARPEIAGVDTFRELQATIHTSSGPESTLLAVIDGVYRNNLTFLEGDELDATKRVFRGEAVIASEPFARRFRIHAGDTVRLEGAKGLLSIPVAGVYADYSRDQGFLLMTKELFSRVREDTRVMSAAVYLRPGHDAAVVESAFRTTFPGEWAVNSSRTLRQRILRIFDQTFAITMVLRSVAIVVAIAGVLLTMLTLVLERRRELALIRALGSTPAFVGWLVVTEAALLGFSSAILGLFAGIPLAMVLTWVVNPAFFGWTIQFHLPWDTIAWTPLWITAVAMLAAWWPARVARNVEIAEALHEE
jgi:putative ABC transport system permease protein